MRSTEVLRVLHLNPHEQAAKEFAVVRKKALLRRIRAVLRKHPSFNRLLSFDEVTEVDRRSEGHARQLGESGGSGSDGRR